MPWSGRFGLSRSHCRSAASCRCEECRCGAGESDGDRRTGWGLLHDHPHSRRGRTSASTPRSDRWLRIRPAAEQPCRDHRSRSGCGFPGPTGQGWTGVRRRKSGLRCRRADRRRGFPPASPLRGNRLLAVAARRHANDMAARGFFSHTWSDSSRGGDRSNRTEYSWAWSGEPVAGGYPSPTDAVDAMISCPAG
jgi:hypothetical protein